MRSNRKESSPKGSEKHSLGYTLRDVFCEKPNIEISDNTLATVEGSRGVLEYSEALIKVNLGAYIVSFCGRGLTLKFISPSSLVIEGVFGNIEFSV